MRNNNQSRRISGINSSKSLTLKFQTVSSRLGGSHISTLQETPQNVIFTGQSAQKRSIFNAEIQKWISEELAIRWGLRTFYVGLAGLTLQKA